MPLNSISGNGLIVLRITFGDQRDLVMVQLNTDPLLLNALGFEGPQGVKRDDMQNFLLFLSLRKINLP